MPGLCPRCNREVYFAEEKLALGKVWHTFCFSCRNCRKLLNSCSVVTHLGELFCKNCYIRFSLATANHEINAISNPAATLAVSVQDSVNCYSSSAENPACNATLTENQYHQSDKCRLRGGGNEADGTNVCFDEEKTYLLDNECVNQSIVKSMTTICDPPPSPTAVTAWYNRQHTKIHSTLSVESQKSNIAVKESQFESQEQKINASELKTSFSNNEVDITQPQLRGDISSTGKTEGTTISWNHQINKCDSAYELNANIIDIRSRRHFAHPPGPVLQNPVPSRRRVSFHDVVFGGICGNNQNRITNMQDAHHTLYCNANNSKECNNNYDIWQADDPAGKSDGGYENMNMSYTEDSGKMYFEKSTSHYGEEGTINRCNGIEKDREQDHCIEDNSESHAYRIVDEKENLSAKEDRIRNRDQSGPNSSDELDDNDRLRGGCGGSCVSHVKVPCGTIKAADTTCCCRREQDLCRTVITTCTNCSSPCVDRRGCCQLLNKRPICKKPIIRCRQTCTTESPICSGGGCCANGCRGSCGKPGQTCLPRSCAVSPCRPCSPCSPPRSCPPPILCCCGRKCGNCCGVAVSTCSCRPKSPACRASRTKRCCSTDRAEPLETGCCRSKTVCEYLGGGLDCQRCGRKVYQAEMQTVSGMPFHNICFSCYCCRKPLEPLTYQENCGEIYCKQCYVRNFGPQGYGYGVGSGTLQTHM